MPRYLLAYHGGHIEETPEGQQRVMAEFGKWFEELGPRLIDPGNPVFASVTIEDGAVTEGGGENPISGYTVIEAEDMQTAIELVQRGPITRGGGSVQVAETRPIM